MVKVEMNESDYKLYQKYKSSGLSLRSKMIVYILFVLVQAAITYYFKK